MKLGHFASALLSLSVAGAAPAQTPVPTQPLPIPQVPTIPVLPGVTTHFSQGWPATLTEKAKALGVASTRDSLHWAQIETVPGQYTFTARNSGHVGRACAAGMTVLLGIEPRNRIYDAGTTAYTAAAQAAYANYLLAIADRYRGCVVAIEVGNEINGQSGMTGSAALTRAASHTALLKAVHQRLKPAHPDLAILGGSTNTIATGFLAKLFAAGALAYVDGIVVHPYRKDPEGTEWELQRLHAAMLKAGRVKPVWATEFSREFANPADAAAFHLKMTALMESAAATHHYWYALIDQRWFPTMGLLTQTGGDKPAGRAFSFHARTLAPRGAARRVDHGDPTLYHFEYGGGAHVVWGGRRAMTVAGTPEFRRADGALAARPGFVGDEPVVILGATGIAFDAPDVLADSLYGFARPPLSWHAVRPATGLTVTLIPIDWDWTTYLGHPTMRQMIVNSAGIGPTVRTNAVVRYTADRSVNGFAALCLVPLGTSGDGTTASLTHNGTTLWSESVGPLTGKRTAAVPVTMAPGDRVEFVLAPKSSPGGDRMRYRFRIVRQEAEAPDC